MTDSKTTFPHPAPPQDIEAEQMVLGALLLEPQLIDAVYARAGDFYSGKNRAVFDALRMLRERRMDVDIVTAAAALRNADEFRESGAAGYLAQIQAQTPTAANFRSHERLVINAAQLRAVIRAGREAEARIQDSDAPADAIIADTITVLNNIRRHEGEEIMPYHDLMQAGFQEIERRYDLHRSGKIAGIPTGFRDLDRKLFGLQPQFYLLAAASGMGKSALLSQIARHAAGHLLREWESSLPETRSTKPPGVGIISLEMGPQQVALRDIASASGVPLSRLLAGTIHDPDWGRLSDTAAAGARLPIHLAFSPFNHRQIGRTIDIMVQQHNVMLLLFDYLQLARVEDHTGTREQEVTELSRLHKYKVKQHNIPHVVVSSLNRGGANRIDKRPVKSDLRESGNLEFDPDVILFLYRDEVYNCKCARNLPCQCGRRGKAEIIVAKGKMEGEGTVDLEWHTNTTTFRDVPE